MNLGLLKNKKKQWGFKRFLLSFKYAANGFKYAYQNEQNLIIHICVTIITVLSGFIFRLNNIEWLFVLIMIGLVVISTDNVLAAGVTSYVSCGSTALPSEIAGIIRAIFLILQIYRY